MAHNNLAGILATNPNADLRDGEEVVRLAEYACEKTNYAEPAFLDTLASAYAEVGDFDRAIETQETAIRLATDRKDTDLVGQFEQYLEIYRQKKPLRRPN